MTRGLKRGLSRYEEIVLARKALVATDPNCPNFGADDRALAKPAGRVNLVTGS
jgi:hypothetical protein